MSSESKESISEPLTNKGRLNFTIRLNQICCRHVNLSLRLKYLFRRWITPFAIFRVRFLQEFLRWRLFNDAHA